MAFESISLLARRAQYKVTEKPLAYSVTGGEHNAGGKLSTLRIRYELAEEVGWKPGDCVDVLWDNDEQLGKLELSGVRGYKLTVTSKRNGIASYRISFTFLADFGFPDVTKQVGCTILEKGAGYIIFRINTEEDKPEEAPEYKLAPPAEDGGIGFTPRIETVR